MPERSNASPQRGNATHSAEERYALRALLRRMLLQARHFGSRAHGRSRSASPQFLDKMGQMMSASYDWSADCKKLPMPVLLVYADNDSISQKHIADFLALLGGGIKEPGWQNAQLSKVHLAIIPRYSHYGD